jgi:hypothetical protein
MYTGSELLRKPDPPPLLLLLLPPPPPSHAVNSLEDRHQASQHASKPSNTGTLSCSSLLLTHPPAHLSPTHQVVIAAPAAAADDDHNVAAAAAAAGAPCQQQHTKLPLLPAAGAPVSNAPAGCCRCWLLQRQQH